MAFRFPLATVLRIRELMEEREEGILQRILLKIAGILDDLARMDAQLRESESLRHAGALKPCLGLDVQAAYGEIKQLQERRKDCELQLQKLEEERAAQVIVYEAARRDREILSELRGQKRAAYEAAATKREQKILDDNYLARRGRSR